VKKKVYASFLNTLRFNLQRAVTLPITSVMSRSRGPILPSPTSGGSVRKMVGGVALDGPPRRRLLITLVFGGYERRGKILR
jgi:hypothetical protein